MAELIIHPVLKKIHGKLGGLVFKKYLDRMIIVQAPGPRTSPPSPAQLAVQEQFKLATIYGHTALADPVAGALYRERAQAKGQPVFSVTVADFCIAPVVDEIDLSAYTGMTGDPIKVRAHDDFEVTGVVVAIRGTDGTVLEGGPAVLGADGLYTYTAKQSLTTGQNVVIEVTATDRPGHKGTKTQAKG